MDVLASIDSNINTNVRAYLNNPRTIKSEIIPLLDQLEYHPKVISNISENESNAFFENISVGQKDEIYPILHFCLSQQDELKDRLYLAPFVSPIEIPLDITMKERDNMLSNLSQRYQMLQEEFVAAHKAYLNAKRSDVEEESWELNHDLRTLQEEKVQLLDRIGAMEDIASDNDEFYHLFELTRELRKCQDDQVRLDARHPEQNRLLEEARIKLKQLKGRHKAIKDLVSNDGDVSSATAASILDEIRKEVAAMTMSIKSDLASQQHDIIENINKLEEENARPLCSEESLQNIVEVREELEESYASQLSCLQEEQSKVSQNKIEMFKKVRSNINLISFVLIGISA